MGRPFDAAKQTNDTGGWQWVDLPQAVLLNGHGFYEDCELLGAGNTATPISCDATQQFVPPGRSKILPFNDPTNPGALLGERGGGREGERGVREREGERYGGEREREGGERRGRGRGREGEGGREVERGGVWLLKPLTSALL